jgi:hypothetical protein
LLNDCETGGAFAARLGKTWLMPQPAPSVAMAIAEPNIHFFIVLFSLTCARAVPSNEQNEYAGMASSHWD